MVFQSQLAESPEPCLNTNSIDCATFWAQQFVTHVVQTLIAAFIVIQDVSRETFAANIEILDVIVTVESLVPGQGDTGAFQVRDVNTEDSVSLDIKVAINFERGDFKASFEGLSPG